MSQEYYQTLWRKTQEDVKKNVAADAKLKKKSPIKNLNTAKWLIGHLFVNYVQIVNRLDECYDQMIHPQKREVISRLLDMCMGRLLELKSEMVRIECDDYIFFDNVLIELKLTHQDLEIQVPKYFWRDREKVKAHRRELIKQVFEEAEREKFRSEYLKSFPEEEREEAWEKHLAMEEQLRLEREKFEEKQRKMLSLKGEKESEKKEVKKKDSEDKEAIVQAIALIQRHERARQGRFKVALLKRMRALKLKGAYGASVPIEAAEKGATVIQRNWKRYLGRKKKARLRKQLEEKLGMVHTNTRDFERKKKWEAVVEARRKMQEENQLEYEEALIEIKEKMKNWYSIAMEEDTVDEIIGWFQWFFSQSGYMPDYPPEKPILPGGEILGIPKKLGPEFAEKLFPDTGNKGKDKGKAKPPSKAQKMSALAVALSGLVEIGGSALVVAGHWIGPKEFAICQRELEKAKKGDKKKVSKEEKLAQKKKEKELEKARLLAEETEGFHLKDSNYLFPLNKADNDYRQIWMERDESKNPEQKYIYELVKEDKCMELSMEVRKAVDEMMILELEILKDALERDKNPKKKKKRKKKSKKGKRQKKKKGKKDPTGDRTLDDLFMELFRNGIIRDYEEAYLKNYLGERSFGAFDKRQRLIDWPPSNGDVRDLIIQLCILPLGSSRIHNLSPLIKSICLLGPENSGKEFLARAVCTETAAVMFDLTPANVAGKYPGKDGLKMLQHLVEKMSRALQPSVIFVDGAEQTFYKKVPREEKQLEPKRLAKTLSKTTKNIKPEDQVLLLGVSSRPWLARKNKFLKTYQKTIYVPQTDYGSRVMLWSNLLYAFGSFPKDFDVSCLAKVSEGYSVKAVADAVKNVMTIERISRSRFLPFTQAEFLDELLKAKLADEKLVNKNIKFYSGLELPKKKAKKFKELKDELEKGQKKK